MTHLSDWHEFNQNDLKTRPQLMNLTVQVRFADGTTVEAKSFEPFVKNSAVEAWRYIKGPRR
jgi:hypothetical protein